MLREGARVSREELLAVLAGAVDRLCSVLVNDGAPSILRMFEASSSYARGRRVRVEQEGGEIMGVTRGLDESGFLMVEQDGGKLTKILTGGVRAASAE